MSQWFVKIGLLEILLSLWGIIFYLIKISRIFLIMNSQYAKFPMLTFSFKSSFFYHVFKIVKILHYCYKFMNVFNYRLCDKKWYLMLMLLMNEYIDILYCTLLYFCTVLFSISVLCELKIETFWKSCTVHRAPNPPPTNQILSIHKFLYCMILKIKKKTKKPQFADRTVQKCKRVQYRISTNW